MLKTKTEKRLFYFYISGTFGHIWAVRPDDWLHLVSNVQPGLQLPAASAQQLPHQRDHAAGGPEIVREADQQLPPAALRGLWYRLPALHPPLLPHHAHHPEDLLQSLGEPHLWELAGEITGVESTAGNAGQVSSIQQWSKPSLGVRQERRGEDSRSRLRTAASEMWGENDWVLNKKYIFDEY